MNKHLTIDKCLIVNKHLAIIIIINSNKHLTVMPCTVGCHAKKNNDYFKNKIGSLALKMSVE